MSETKLTKDWTFWYHSCQCEDWGIDSYKDIFTFNTVEDFWALFNKLNHAILHSGVFFLTQANIKPTWEDPAHISGGCWSYKVTIKETVNIWQELCVHAIAESLSVNPSSKIGCLSISPKRNFYIVKVWNDNNKISDLESMTTIKSLKNIQPLYTAFGAPSSVQET